MLGLFSMREGLCPIDAPAVTCDPEVKPGPPLIRVACGCSLIGTLTELFLCTMEVTSAGIPDFAACQFGFFSECKYERLVSRSGTLA